MKNKKVTILVLCVFFAFAIGAWLIGGSLSLATIAEKPEESKGPVVAENPQISKSKGSKTTAKKVVTESYSTQTEQIPEDRELKTGSINLGRFIGQVVYDKEKNYYFLELRGARFPFKTSPIQAQEVLLEAPGKNELEKNTSLLYGILGQGVLHTTLLINPDEEDDVMPAATDIARYIQIVNPRKFAGIGYTKPGGKLKRSVVKGSQIQALEDATSETPIIQIKGPKSGSSKTRVLVIDGGKVIVEGKTYEDVYKAADLICITLLKMLCGSPECPDAAVCATGGDCGC